MITPEGHQAMRAEHAAGKNLGSALPAQTAEGRPMSDTEINLRERVLAHLNDVKVDANGRPMALAVGSIRYLLGEPSTDVVVEALDALVHEGAVRRLSLAEAEVSGWAAYGDPNFYVSAEKHSQVLKARREQRRNAERNVLRREAEAIIARCHQDDVDLLYAEMAAAAGLHPTYEIPETRFGNE